MARRKKKQDMSSAHTLARCVYLVLAGALSRISHLRFGETEDLKKHINLAEGFDINARDVSGCTIMLWAARNGHDETVKYMCSINADVNATGFGGWSALQHAVSSSRENMVALLLEQDANPNIPDETGTGALHIAAARGAINIVVRLIEAHADVNAQNGMSVRPLHHGALFGQTACIKKLVEYGADVDAQDAAGNTPLHLAAHMSFEPAIQFLLGVCNKQITNKENKMPVDLTRSPDIKKLLD